MSFERKLQRQKGRVSRERFVGIPHHIVMSPEYAAMSGRASKLLTVLLAQYNGTNNGALVASPSVMKPRGFTSGDQLWKAVQELLAAGWITETRKGGRHAPTQYAVTFRDLDDCGGKLDIKLTRRRLDLWKREHAAARPQYRLTATRGSLARKTGNVFPAARGSEPQSCPPGGEVEASFAVVASPPCGEKY